ncbi:MULTISPECIES: GntR family transcriptional regulator [Roseobacteraceae]|jgi:DNA-binding GntR family transcriptional regulator|uniref:HTH-type transcriptional regulator McbR n=1 Tax=Pseudosulfitobacter pseudonitzschiae TaxID=1402135 RepID=A0A221K6U0_9RHOB|nr:MULTISPECIES: GntR family transcriptional regulator [Roseobacteraceae]ASM74732.1 HTH-type transcriptional regulator McbR [Pseudosulfitobacter pseudonitzschiae]
MEQRSAVNIANSLEHMIFDGTFADGDRLDEVRLAEQFGVSRTPLREALQRLESSGLVTLIPRRGAFVRQPGPLELLEMFEVMAELEAVCARLAARRISDAAFDELRAANARCQAASDAQNADLYYAENELFHATIYRESGNSFLEQESLKLQKRLRPFRRQQLHYRGRMVQSLAEHENIVAALMSGDSDAAGDALRSHVTIQGERFHSLMTSLKSAAS